MTGRRSGCTRGGGRLSASKNRFQAVYRKSRGDFPVSLVTVSGLYSRCRPEVGGSTSSRRCLESGLGTSPDVVFWQLPRTEVVVRRLSKAEVEFQ